MGEIILAGIIGLIFSMMIVHFVNKNTEKEIQKAIDRRYNLEQVKKKVEGIKMSNKLEGEEGEIAKLLEEIGEI